jgi:hypothetical protein
MAQTIPRCMPTAMARRLHALAERRCTHFAELHASGRWAHYYDYDQFLACMAQAQALASISQSMVHQAERAPAEAPRPKRFN